MSLLGETLSRREFHLGKKTRLSNFSVKQMSAISYGSPDLLTFFLVMMIVSVQTYLMNIKNYFPFIT
jgi:hypothetical protein